MVAVESTTIRVLVVDDHPSVRTGIRAMLTGGTRIRPCVVDEAATTEETAELRDSVLAIIRAEGEA